MKIKCFSKINLGLNVFPKTHDQQLKHKIESIFILYKEIYDWLEINISNTSQHRINYFFNKKKYSIRDCLIHKTLTYLYTRNIINDFYQVNITKNIPIGSGLGGGSSDAGNLIYFLAKQNNKLNKLDYKDIAINLGSDIPFFISQNDAAIVSEYGNKIIPIQLKTRFKFNVIINDELIETKNIFDIYDNQVDECKTHNDFYKIIDDINKNNINGIRLLNNNLENLVYKQYPKLELKRNLLLKTNDFIILSGSGSSMVSINDKNIKVRTRYAPSPTGKFHIGGARTAIFNYLFAKHYGGKFIVRIEDTDIDRNVEGGIESQLSNLEWLKIFPDESINNPGKFGPYIQSKKLSRYKLLSQSLVESNKAYYCFCSNEQLELDRKNALENHTTPKYSRRCLHLDKQTIESNLKNNIPYTIRLKIDENKDYYWDDLIRGKISIPGDAMTDPVILKSNGIAMYNFAVVVDDYDMQISHVLRGEEHISNTPYQIAIRDALGFNNEIQYGHLSVIIDESGKKLSKRNESLKQFVNDYKQMGFVPESITNFLSLLGWSSDDNQEIMSIDNLIHRFDINNLSKSPTFFDFSKMLWIGNEYIKKMDNDLYLSFVKNFIDYSLLNNHLKNNLDLLLLLFKNQISYATQLNDLIKENLIDEYKLNDIDINIVKNNLDVVNTFKNLLVNSSTFNEELIKELIEQTKLITNKKGKDLFMPIRLAATHLSHGPELAKIIFLINKNKVITNIDKIIKVLN